MYTVYVLWSESIKKRYIGQTNNLSHRINQHNNGLSHWTKQGVPWNIVNTESFGSRSEAILRERFLKSGKGREFLGACLKSA